jgi:hypothetical protein
LFGNFVLLETLILAVLVLQVVCLLAAAFCGAGVMFWAYAFLNLLVKISAKVASADIVSSPMTAKGTSGRVFLKAPVMSWAAISIRYVDEICGMGEL